MVELGTTIKNKLLANQWSFLLIVMIILSIVAGSVNPRYWWLGNITNLLGQISVLSLVACGATILIISGNFDISVGANIGLSSVVMAILMRNGLFPPLAAGIGILIAIVCSSLIGTASILFQAPSFIISLAAIGGSCRLPLSSTHRRNWRYRARRSFACGLNCGPTSLTILPIIEKHGASWPGFLR